MFVFSGAFGTEMSFTQNTEEGMTMEMTFKCLAKDFSRHWTADAAGSPLLIPIP